MTLPRADSAGSQIPAALGGIETRDGVGSRDAGAVFPIVMAWHYQGDPGTTMRVVIGTSVVGLATIPLCIRFGMKFVGL